MPYLPAGRPATRIDERHVAVRFNDALRDGHWHIWFNDVQVEGAIDEAYAGDWGWVHAPPSPQHLLGRVLIGRVAMRTCHDEPCELRARTVYNLDRFAALGTAVGTSSQKNLAPDTVPERFPDSE